MDTYRISCYCLCWSEWRSGLLSWDFHCGVSCCCDLIEITENLDRDISKNHRGFYWVVATQNFFIFTPKIGEDEPNLTCAYFSNRLVKNHQLGSTSFPKGKVIVFQVSGAFQRQAIVRCTNFRGAPGDGEFLQKRRGSQILKKYPLKNGFIFKHP